ncbi:unnamed protein product [Enterobius vermicularis]|uniref:Secreted protein n=1 Tax=Enterobius vermicularis TaxID=51028 RepID=A0A0N4VQ43_ENTVE|nr:unnamed protein product [Enterobius vermicularis]
MREAKITQLIAVTLFALSTTVYGYNEYLTPSGRSRDSVLGTLSRHDPLYQIAHFTGYLKQRVFGNSVPQCPCVIKPGTNKCITYDSRFQAASIEEAILAFPDISADTRRLADTNGGALDAETFACRTIECQTCVALLVARLVAVGLLRAATDVSLPMPSVIDRRYCRRLRFANPPPIFEPPAIVPPYMKRLIDEGHRFAASAAARNRNNVRRFSSLPAPNGGSQKQQPSQQYSQQYVYPQKAQPQYVQQQPIVQYPQKTVPTGKPLGCVMLFDIKGLETLIIQDFLCILLV